MDELNIDTSPIHVLFGNYFVTIVFGTHTLVFLHDNDIYILVRYSWDTWPVI